MKKVSINELKGQLSAAVAKAEAGQTLLITRHNRPVAQLTPARGPHVNVARRVRASALEPLLTRATRGRYLEVLLEDRRGPGDA